MNFHTENEMSLYFDDLMNEKTSNRPILVLTEVPGLYGIPDYVCVEQHNDELYHIIAFELKLSNWKRALYQAFRYRNFANQAYVVIDEKKIGLCKKNIHLFRQYNIGLASFNKNKELRIHFEPENCPPFSEYYSEKFKEVVLTYNEDSENERINCSKEKHQLKYLLSNFIV